MGSNSLAYEVDGPAPGIRVSVGIDVQGNGCVGVTEERDDGLHVGADFDDSCRKAMAQIVKSDSAALHARELVGIGKRLLAVSDVGWGAVAAVYVAHDVVVFEVVYLELNSVLLDSYGADFLVVVKNAR